MKKAIIGYGAVAREVVAMIDLRDPVFFVDDQYWTDGINGLYPLSGFDPCLYEVVVAIGDSKARSDIVSRLPESTKFFTVVHKSAQILGNNVEIGEGSIICGGVIISVDTKIGKHAHINFGSNIAHDCLIGDFFTSAPGVNVSGNNTFGDRVYIGTGSSTRQKISICDDVIVGMQSGVVKSIHQSGTYVGCPTRKISHE